MNLHVKRIRKREDKFIPVFLVIHNIVSQPTVDCLTEALDLSTCLEMVFSKLYRPYAMFCALRCKNLDMYYGPFSLRTFVDRRKLPTQRSRKIVSSVVSIVFVLGVALVFFQKWSVISKMYWMPLFVFKIGRRTSIAMSSKGSVVRNNRNFVVVILFSGYVRTI